MSTNEIVFSDIKLGGLGTVLSAVSSMVHIPDPVVWKIDGSTYSERALISYLINCYGIPKHKFRVDFSNTVLGARRDITDIGKFFSPYITTDHITCHDKRFPVRTCDKIKPCVGIALYDKRKHPGDTNHRAFNTEEFQQIKHSWPERKMWPIDTNLKIINLLISAGYDVISLDSAALRLEDKIYTLNEHCDFVIGYEGGLHHLAHTLNIPSIVLPWSNPFPIRNHDLFIHALHLDKKTGFPNSISEVLSLSPTELMDMRNRLVNQGGNNLFLTNKIGFTKNFRHIRIHDSSDNVRETDWAFFNHSIDIIHSKITDKKIAGIQEFYYF